MSSYSSYSSYTSLLTLLVQCATSDVSDYLLKQPGVDIKDQKNPREAKELAEELKKRGPAYIKLGQFLSTQSNVFPKEYIEALKTLQDEVETVPFAEIEKLIRDELDEDKAAALLAGIDKTPLASASLGQVHAAVLPTGRKVVVKVQRPGAEERLQSDFRAFETVASLLDGFQVGGRSINFKENLSLFKKSLWRELQYEKEAQNLRALKSIVEGLNMIVVPAPVERYSTNKILVMERVEGRKVEEIDEEYRQNHDCYLLADQLFHAYLRQLLVEGIVHMDPHPGNIILDEKGHLAIIDAGMVSYFSSSMCSGLLKIVLAISEGRGEDVAHAAIKLGEISEDFSRVSFVNEIASLVTEHAHLPLGQITPGKIVLEIGRIAHSAGLKLPSQFTVIGQTLMKLDAVGKVLEPNFDPKASIRRHSTKLLRDKTSPSFSIHNLYKEITDLAELLGTFPGHAQQIIEKLAHNELELSVNAIDERLFIQGLEKIANRITTGLIIAALIIGAAMLTHIESTFTLFGYPVIALFFFIVASMMGLKLVWGMMVNDN